MQEIIHNLRCSNDPRERIKALEQLRSNFPLLPDKEKAGNDLHKLATDDNSDVRRPAVLVLSEFFDYIPDKQTSWEDLHNLTKDIDTDVRWMAAFSLGAVFSEAPHKQQAWNDLHRLTLDINSSVRGMAAKSLRFVFPHISDKEEVWNDLHRLTYDEDNIVRGVAAKSLRSAFPYISDKEGVWNDLHRLSVDGDRNVRLGATITLGSSYSHIPDKETALKDLSKLANDKDWAVRSEAYHSLGKVSIFWAAQVEKEKNYREELEKAIEFFEKASQKSISSSPSQFCLPLYRSFYTIIFNKQKAKEEVDTYLAEAKDAVKGSKSKELLFKAVENLANASKEVQSLENLDLEAKKDVFDFYRKHCDLAEECIRDLEETVPFATAAMRKGLPILDNNVKKLLEEVQNKAKITCKESKGTPTQEIACAVNREVQKWKIGNQEEIAYFVCEGVQRWEIGRQEEMSLHVANIILVLKSKIPHVPENKGILGMIESINYEKDLSRVLCYLSILIGLIPTVNVVPVAAVKEEFEDLKTSVNKISEQLEELSVSLDPKSKAEIVISKGVQFGGTGAQVVTTIPFEKISYPELLEDLEYIKGKATKVSELPSRLVNKIKSYLS